MNDLKSYTVNLLKSRIIDVTPFVAQRDGKWMLTKAFAGISPNTSFPNEVELYDRIATGLVAQAESGGLRVAS